MNETVQALIICDRNAPMVTRHELFVTLPQGMVTALVRYLATGHPLGGFLTALVQGALFRAACEADSDNNPRLADFAKWIAQSWPPRTFGSPERVTDWQEHHGFKGRDD